jgi:hypothetical protein
MLIKRALCLPAIPSLFLLGSALGAGERANVSAVTMAEAQQGREVVRVAVGSGQDDIGYLVGQEAASEGPTCLALDGDGAIYVLDHVNARIQVFEGGRRARSIPIPPVGWQPGSRDYGPIFKAIDVAGDGRTALLDDLMTKSVFLLDANGTVLRRLPLAGEHVPQKRRGEQIPMRSVAWRGDGVWVEYEGHAIRIADPGGRPLRSRLSVKGSFALDGKRIKRLRHDAATAVVRLLERDHNEWLEYRLPYGGPLSRLDGPYRDKTGATLFIVAHWDTGGPGTRIVVLDSNGRERKRLLLRESPLIESAERDFCLAHDGTIYQMTIVGEAFIIRAYDP